jgi:hypothetical protein
VIIYSPCHDIAEILLKVTLNTRTHTLFTVNFIGAVVVVIVMVVGYTSTYAPSAITTNVVSSIPAHGGVYSIQYYVSDLRQVGGLLWVFRFPPPITLTITI